MLIGVPLETAAGESRVAVTPETAKKLRSQGHQLFVQSGAGKAASAPDAAYAAVRAEIVNAKAAFGCDLVLKVRSPSAEELPLMKRGATLVGMLNPFNREGLERLAAAGVTGFALEAAPRTTRAQSRDVISSQTNIAAYKAVIIAADRYQKFFPLLMTAAGEAGRHDAAAWSAMAAAAGTAPCRPGCAAAQKRWRRPTEKLVDESRVPMNVGSG